jgi:hypothetical protein
MYAAGVAFLTIGSIGIAGGAALLIVGTDAPLNAAGAAAPGGVVLGVGALFLALGVPMLVVGGKRVPDNATTTRVDWRPEVVAAPGGGGLRWTF